MAQKQQKREFEFLTSERLKELRERGWSDKKIASYLFMVNSEGGPKEEDLFYKTPERVVEVFSKNSFFKGIKDYNEMIEKVKNSGVLRNPELFGNTFYGDRLGNKGGKDGYAFRGRGNVQMTGRNNYRAVGGIMGIDLEANPDLVTSDPRIQWTSGAVFVDMNDKGNKAITPRQMYDIIRPATSFEESLKRGRVPSVNELDEIAKRNDSFNAVQKIANKPASKTPTPKSLPPPMVVEETEDRIIINDEISAPRRGSVIEKPDPNKEALQKGQISIQTYMEKKMREEGLK
jgi:predicted chitinase